MSFNPMKIRNEFAKADKERDAGNVIPDSVEVIKDIPYADGGKYNLLDILRPKDSGDSELPVIVSVHGGAYLYGTKEVYRFYTADLATHGFAVINFNYSLVPDRIYPTQLAEINKVFEWLLNNADKYALDTDNIFMVGDSAGAQLASHYAAIATNEDFATKFAFNIPENLVIKGVALNCGFYSPDEIIKDPENDMIHMYFGKGFDENDDSIKVLNNITNRFPPSFVMTAENDSLKEMAAPMADFLKSKGIKVVYKKYGEPGQEYMVHIFHANMKLEEAHTCNKEECDFFKSLMA